VARRVVKIGLTGSDRLVWMGEGRRLTGHRIGDAGAVGSGPNLSRMLCNSCRVASPSLLMSSNARSRARTVWLSSWRVFNHIVWGHQRRMEIKACRGEGVLRSSIGRGRGVRWESEVAYGDSGVRKNWLSVEILSYCKGNCSRRVRKRK